MNEITKYVVDVDYRKFEFDDGEAALSFAETAAQTCTDARHVAVYIHTEPEKADVEL